MTFESLLLQFKMARPLIILRASSAPLMLSFFHRVFRQSHITTISNNELRNKLESYMDDIEYAQKDDELESNTLFDDYSLKAAQYIEKWSNAGFLRKYPNDSGEDLHELTSDTVKVFEWLEDLQRPDHIGTNSRFRDIYFKLKSMIEQSTESVEVRIQALENKKWEIENEINLLKNGKKPTIVDDTEIKEEFYNLNKMARELLNDFAEVEQNFEEIRKEVQRKYAEKDIIKGSLLVYALDALDDIENKDQGRSFKAFWEFLMDEQRQNEFSDLTDKLYQLLQDRDINYNNDKFLRYLKRYLHFSGRKVIDSNKKLSEKMSRILSEKSLQERKRASELINDIRQLAYGIVEARIKEDSFITVEMEPSISLPGRWELYDGKEVGNYTIFPDGIGGELSPEVDLSALFDQFTIDKKKLQQNIDSMLIGETKQVSLKEVTDRFGIKNGLSEVVGYFSIAASIDHHLIIENAIDPIWINGRKVNIPMILYTKPTI